MGDFMQCRIRTSYWLVLLAAAPAAFLAAPAAAKSLPEIRLSIANAVPACATPARLTAFLESRNARLDNRFKPLARAYKRIGEDLNVRWDTAFFQMMLETGNLTFTGDVSAKQNNFAGLGATGKKNPGESFPDLETGVKAHLQHLLLYAGEKLDNPVAERTRKVQEWGVLNDWQKSVTGPMTYALIAKQWAPGSRTYVRDIESVADAFYAGACKAAEPKQEVADEAAGANAAVVTAAIAPSAAEAADAPKLSGADLARRAVEQARESGSFVRSNLGAGPTQPEASAAAAPQPPVTILNAAKPEPTIEIPNAATAAPETTARVETAALGVGTKGAAASAPAKPQNVIAIPDLAKCKVWTASYGGPRAVIIKASANQLDNYTVLDVNEGAEKREADAYIAAYAKGGQTVGEFTNPSQALDKAFELCPEG